jgi:endo-1,4-beta-xylanase
MKITKQHIGIALVVLVVLVLATSTWLFLGSDKFKAAPKLPDPPLKELAKRHDIQIGTFIAYNYVTDRPYREIVESQFEYAIVDGQPNWIFEDGSLRPGPNDFDFSRLDKMVQFAEERKMPIRIQHFVWGEEKWLPAWLKDGNYNREELFGFLENHIKTVGSRYKGRIREYTVVNEAFSRKLRANNLTEWWGDRLGYEYIDKSFQWAKETDPNAILILNDFGNEIKNANSDEMYNYVKSALERGVPIDAIGMQMHLDANNPPAKEAVKENMRRFGDLGLKVYITEFDVHLHDLPQPRDQELEIQAKVYKDMLEACKEVGPDVCPNFGLLGLTDQQTWYKGLGLKGSMPLSFDDNYNPKPAFFGLREALQ